MDFLSTMEHGGAHTTGPRPPGVTPITELKNQKRVSRTLSRAVGVKPSSGASRVMRVAMACWREDAGGAAFGMSAVRV